MITYVLTISETFPKTHKRAGQGTGFPLSIKHYEKIHTIRSNYALWKKRFEKIDKGLAILVLKVWVGKPYGKGSTQHSIFKYDNTWGIGIEKLEFHKNKDEIPCIKYPLVNNYAEPNIETIAQNDGLSWPDFKEWFRTYDLDNELAIIHFTDFRYAKKN
jgi:hypothetical protein